MPLSSTVTQPRALRSTAATVSPNLKVTARSRRWYFSASTTSRSQKSSMRSRRSTTVTLVPRAANMEAYSMPITPAPTTTIESGTRSSRIMPSESITVRSSNSTLSGRAGRVPVAMMILSAVTLLPLPYSSTTSMVCGSRNLPEPTSVVTWLRES